MALLREKYVYHNRRRRKKSLVRRIIFLLICGGILVGTVLLIGGILKSRSRQFADKEVTILDLWNEKNYTGIIEKCDELLVEKPLDSYLLAYRGFANFYKADSELEDQGYFYDQAVINLRKALLDSEPPFLKEIYFILGISYFYKDKYYFDLAVKYIEMAIEAGMDSTDALIRLGIAYGKLGDTEKELACLQEAMNKTPTDWLYLLIGKAHFKMNQFDQAEEYLVRYINRVDDSDTEQEARFRLGEIYLQREDYSHAREQYQEIIKLDNRSAEAHFNLGEIYFQLNDLVKARAEWRETLRIDPSHYGARLRYYN